MAEVVLEKIGKSYVDGTKAVDGLSLDIANGEFLVLVGPSGCGKTTALRMVAGLEDISEGNIRIDGRVVNQVPARDRDVAMVFQSYALYPHLEVYENIAFGLRLRRVPKPEIDDRVRAAATVLGLEEHLHRRPGALSGGQRQRVAMGRAIVRDPAVFLMDEPLSNLDAKLRVQMRAEIARTTRRMGVTTLYVTHDQTEAMTLGDRVAVLKRGILQQIDTPQRLYDEPMNLFVAGFIGSPAMNLVRGMLTLDAGQLVLHLGTQQIPVSSGLLAVRPRLREYVGRPVAIGIRPEDMEDAALLASQSIGSGQLALGSLLQADVELIEALGSDLLVHFTMGADPVVTEDIKELARDAGADVPAGIGTPSGAQQALMVARFSPRSQARVGGQIRIAVDTERLHIFDIETGLSVR